MYLVTTLGGKKIKSFKNGSDARAFTWYGGCEYCIMWKIHKGRAEKYCTRFRVHIY